MATTKVTDMASLKEIVMQCKTSIIMNQPFLRVFASVTEDVFLDKFVAPGAVAPLVNGSIKMYFGLQNIIEAGFTGIGDIYALIQHEYAHVYLAHLFSKCPNGEADNIAADLEINQDTYIKSTPALRAYGVFVDNPAFVAMGMKPNSTREVYYEILMKNAKGGKGGKGNAGTGKTLDDHSQVPDSTNNDTLRDVWREKVEQALDASKGQGSMPAGMEERITAIWKRLPDLEGRLRRCITARVRGRGGKTRFTHNRINHVNAYNRGKKRCLVPRVVFAFDTSGSMSSRFLSEVVSVMGWAIRKFGRVDIIQCDADVQEVMENVRVAPTEFNLKGRGGTDFTPVFKYIDEKWGGEVDALVFCTDLCGTFPDTAPDYKTIWVTDTKDSEPSFGEVVLFE